MSCIMCQTQDTLYTYRTIIPMYLCNDLIVTDCNLYVHNKMKIFSGIIIYVHEGKIEFHLWEGCFIYGNDVVKFAIFE